jgi:hypothetical protein
MTIRAVSDAAPRTVDPAPYEAMMHAAVAKGAVAMMIVFELPDGSTERLCHPDMGCVARGLTDAVTTIDDVEER